MCCPAFAFCCNSIAFGVWSPAWGYLFVYCNATISLLGPGVFGWGHRKPRWSHLGSSSFFLDHVGANLGRFGIILACLRSLFIRIGCVLCCPAFVFCWSSIAFWVLSPASRSSRAVLVFFSDRVGANLTRFGIMLVCLGGISGGWPS